MTAILLIVLSLAAGPPIRPDPRLTPGAVATTDLRTICVPGYASRVRAVSGATKRAVYAAYGIKPTNRLIITKAGDSALDSNFEIDHLDSLQLGGSNAPTNLWPQSKLTRPYNALVKDRLEQHLGREVCAGRLDLADVQRRIADDWIALYRDLLPTKGTP